MDTFLVYKAGAETAKGKRGTTPVFEEGLWKLEYKLLLYLCINSVRADTMMQREHFNVGEDGGSAQENEPLEHR